MAWTATLLRKEERAGFIDFVVEFTDGFQTFIQQFRSQGTLDADGIKRQVNGRLSELNRLASIDIAIGEKDFIETVKDPPPVKDPPTQLKLDFVAWRANQQQLRVMEELVTMRAIPNSHVTVVALRAAVIADYQEAFLPLLGVS